MPLTGDDTRGLQYLRHTNVPDLGAMAVKQEVAEDGYSDDQVNFELYHRHNPAHPLCLARGLGPCSKIQRR